MIEEHVAGVLCGVHGGVEPPLFHLLRHLRVEVFAAIRVEYEHGPGIERLREVWLTNLPIRRETSQGRGTQAIIDKALRASPDPFRVAIGVIGPEATLRTRIISMRA